MGNVKKSYEQNNKTADFYRLTDKIERRVCQRSYLLLWMMSIRINNNPSSWSGFTWQHSLSISTQSIGNDRFYSKHYRSSAYNVIYCDFIPKWIEKYDAIGVNWIHENCWIEEMWPSQWHETRNGFFSSISLFNWIYIYNGGDWDRIRLQSKWKRKNIIVNRVRFFSILAFSSSHWKFTGFPWISF